MPRNNSGLRRDVRREEAEVRATVRAGRTPQEQLEVLDERLGEGVGAARERTRLGQVARRNEQVTDGQEVKAAPQATDDTGRKRVRRSGKSKQAAGA